MKKFLALILFLSACSSGAPDMAELSRSDAPIPRGQNSPHVQANARNETNKVSGACAAALSLADRLDDGTTFSVYKRFNPYPPVSPVRSPGDISMPVATEGGLDLVACVPEGMIDFSILDNGSLVAGTIKDLYPLGVFQATDGFYIAFYLHKDYEVGDGEGEVVEVSGLVLDSSGEIANVVQGLSSWYEYEGSIRIRDFLYEAGRAVTTEQIYDPVARDESGYPLTYVDVGGIKVLKEHRFGAPER